MDDPLVVVQESDDGLYQEKWVFHWSRYAITLQRYQKSRKTKGKWVVTHFYDAHDQGGYGNWAWLKESEVPWDDDIKAEVALAVVSRISVKRPSET